MRFLGTAVLATLVATPAFAQTDYIGGADSGAIITNGDLEELTPVLTSNTSQYLGSGGGTVNITPNGTPLTLEDLQMAGLNGDLVRILIDIPTSLSPTGPNIQIPGFTLRRNQAVAGGNGNFGFGGSEGTPLTTDANAGNTTAYFNNGALSLISDAIDLGGSAATGTTFTLSFDIGVDGAGMAGGMMNTDIIDFTPILRVGDVVVSGGALQLSGPDIASAVVNGSTATFTGGDLTATITQEFTLPNDLSGDTVSVEIAFEEDESTQPQGGGNRGSVDNIVLTGNFLQSTALFGDFNNDGIVGPADYAVWRDAMAAGSDETALNGLGNGDNVVDRLDYDLWVERFGSTSTPLAAAVPEPASFALLAAVAGFAVCRARR